MEPITRSEMLMDGQYVEPITRKEKILAGDDLEPVTREEYFLKKYRHSGGDVDVVQLTATENKTYTAPEGKAYNPVKVNVPEKQLIGLYADENKTYRPSTGYDGFSEVTVDVPTPPPSLQSLTASHNGYFVPSSGYDGFSEVNVDVALPQNAYLLESQRGDIATIQHGAEFDMPKLIVSIEPQQDLHGYDSPWVGGGGKNKLPLTIDAIKSLNTGGTWNNNAYSINGGTLTLMTDNSGNVIGININGTFNDSTTFHLINSNSVVFPNNQYILNGISGGSASTYRYLYLSPSSGYLYSDGGDTLLNLDEGVSKIRLLINSGYNAQNVKVYPMIRLATESDATFEPYSNICPISGWSACNVVRTGGNLFDVANTATIYPKLKQGQTIYAKQNSANDFGLYVLYEGDSQSTALQLNSNTKASMVLTKDVVQIAISDSARNAVISQGKDIMVSTTDFTDIEPYNGNTYTINFTDGTNPLTVYGGTLNVLTGLLTVTDAYYSSPLTWQKNTGLGYTFFNANSVINDKKENVACNYYKAVSKARDSLLDGEIGTWNTSSSFVPCIRDDSKADLTAEEFTTAMSGLTFTYKLATPQTYQLTPTEVKSLLGVNNIWADTGEVDVQMWTKEV